MNKLNIILVTICCMFSLIGCKNNKITEDYPSLQGTKNIVSYTTASEVAKHLSSDYTGIIMFGFKRCPWCQAAIPYVNEIAKEKGFKKVEYLDIKDMRDNENSNDRPLYTEIFEKIKEKIGNPEKIFAPTVIVLNKGEIKGYHVGTVDSHQKVDGNLPLMTEEQIVELREIYRNLFTLAYN